MIVSITDQVLIVCADGHPEVLLDQPEAGVVDVREEQRAGADGQHQQRDARAGRGRSASGATMPAAVMVATVAEPVASRMPTATSQPSTSAEMFAPSAASAITSPTPASISVCLKPPPAATISRMPAIAGSAPPTEAEICVRGRIPAAHAEREHRRRSRRPAARRPGRRRCRARAAAAAVVQGELGDRAEQHEHHRQQHGRDRRAEAGPPQRPVALGRPVGRRGPAGPPSPSRSAVVAAGRGRGRRRPVESPVRRRLAADPAPARGRRRAALGHGTATYRLMNVPNIGPGDDHASGWRRAGRAPASARGRRSARRSRPAGRGAAARGRAAPTGRPAPGCRPAAAARRCGGRPAARPAPAARRRPRRTAACRSARRRRAIAHGSTPGDTRSTIVLHDAGRRRRSRPAGRRSSRRAR